MSPRPAFDLSDRVKELLRLGSYDRWLAARAAFNALVQGARADANSRKLDPAVGTLWRLREEQRWLDDKLDLAIAWARVRDVPRHVIAEVLDEGRSTNDRSREGDGTNLDRRHPRYLDAFEEISDAAFGEPQDRVIVGEMSIRPDDLGYQGPRKRHRINPATRFRVIKA